MRVRIANAHTDRQTLSALFIRLIFDERFQYTVKPMKVGTLFVQQY